MNTYKLVIGYNPQQYETGSTDESEYLFLDTINDRQISGSNTTPGQPMQNGEFISDHTYRNPDTMSVSGVFSLDSSQVYNLNKDQDYINQFTSAGADRLTRIQETFEGIKKGGYLCTLTFMSMPDTTARLNKGTASGNETRFKVRKNMQLESFSWVESLNTIKYTLSFKEVIFVNQQEYYNLPAEELIYYNLPKITDLPASSLGMVLTDPNNNELYEMVIRQLYDKGYIDKAFMKYIAENKSKAWANAGMAILCKVIAEVAVAVGVAITVTAVTTTATTASVALSAVFPVGTVIAGAIAIAALGFAIGFWIKSNKHRKKKNVIKLVKKSANEGLDKLKNLFDKIKTSLVNIESGVSIYTFNSDEPQQTLIKIGGKTYVIEASQNNVTSSNNWNFKVLDVNQKLISTAINNSPNPVTNMSQLSDPNVSASQIWFNDASGQYEVYLVNLSLDLEENKENQAAMNNVKSRLTTYSIWVSEGNISDNIQILLKAVTELIAEEGYK